MTKMKAAHPCRRDEMTKMRAPHPLTVLLLAVAGLVSWVPCGVRAEPWETVDFVRHSDYQSVNANGTSAYAGGFPARLRGVVLNDTEDWLNPTAAYDPGVHLWQLGGEAEIFVQAIDLPGDTWDDGDFGGTACWMGQNYGNHVIRQDPQFNYTDAEWYAELDRLGWWRPESGVSPLVRAGALIEIRARAGLNYAGKMNVNEQHDNDPIRDFDIVLLEEAYGLPEPAPVTLSVLKDDSDVAIFDPTRASGGERYQSTRVEIQNVRLADAADWGSNSDLVLTDASGRTLAIHLGLNDSFATTTAPEGYCNVIGILDQKSPSGTAGYRLLAMHADDFTFVGGTGDVNGDGEVNGLDVDPFVAVLLAGSYTLHADTNGDGAVNGLDVDRFVDFVVGAGGRAVPEPPTILLATAVLSVLVLVRGRPCVARRD